MFVVVLLALWLVGTLFAHTLGGFLHVFLAIALVLLLNELHSRKTGYALTGRDLMQRANHLAGRRNADSTHVAGFASANERLRDGSIRIWRNKWD